MTMQQEINAVQSPIARELLQGLYDALCDAIVIPNHMLPEEYHNHKNWEAGSRRHASGKVFGPTVSQINKTYDRKYAKRDAKRAEKLEKEERIAAYAAQWEANPEQPLEYIEDERKAYMNQLRFVEAGIKSGMIQINED